MLGTLVPLLLAPPVAPLLALMPPLALLISAPAPAPLAPRSLIARTTTTASVALSAEWLELKTSSTAPRPRPAAGHIRVVYTGGAGGIGSGRYDFGIAQRLARDVTAAGGQLQDARPFHGVAARGVHLLIAEDRRVATLVALFEGGAIRCGEPEPARSARTADTRMLVLGAAVPPVVRGLPGQLVVTAYERRRCANARGASAWLFGPAHKPLALEGLTLRDFELRLGLVMQVAGADPFELQVIGVPADDAARRFRALRSLVGATGVLYVDAGGFVDGASTILDGQLSLHRPLGLRMLEQLRPAALAPGDTELAAGARQLMDERRAHHLPYVATNWEASDPDLELPTVVTATVTTEVGPARVAFLGAVDPALALAVPQLAREGVTLTEPVAALDAEVRRLQALPTPPDLIVVLTSARWQIYEALQAELRGIDLVIGETSPIENRMRTTELSLRPSTARHRLSAAIAPIFGVAVAELEVVRARSERLMLRRLTIEPHRMIERLDPDPEVMARVTETRARTYPALDRPLVRAPGSATDPLSPALWARVVCETVRRRTDADVVLLPELPRLLEVMGPQTELLALNGLLGFDLLEEHVVLGKKLADLLRDAPSVTPVSCGGQTGVRAPKVLGRAIEDARSYRVVSTDRARASGLGALLAGSTGARVLDARAPRGLLDPAGRALSLRAAVLDTLRALRDEAGADTAPVDALLVPSETTREGLALVRVNRLSFALSSFEGAGARALPNVKETRAHAVSSLTLGGDADVALAVEGRALIGEARAQARYARLESEGAESLEQADDLRFSAALSAPALELAMGPVGVMPYSEVSFDTEWTPTTPGGERQAALFLTGGVSVLRVPTVTSFRVGASAGRDLSLDQPFAFSLRTEVESTIELGYELSLKLRAVGDWFAPTAAETDANLRLGYTFEGRLALPLARWLNVGAFAQSYLFQGALAGELAAAHTLGVALDVAGAFRL